MRYKMSRVWDSIKKFFINTFSLGKNKEQIRALKESLKSMENENKNLTIEAEELKYKVRNFNLVSEALKAESTENSFIKEFADLIEHDYKKDFCNQERGSNDAENLRELDYILQELKLIANCPDLHSKSIGAIGGGFSSGKSSLINSFFSGDELKLAVGIKPVTAIPSYVINGDSGSMVRGISFKGGNFPIELDVYKKISHDFMKSFDFDLKKIINYITVLTPMDNKYFNNLCLIDTPGYNPPDSGNTKKDSETARKYIENAQFLIWTVGLDANGTIPKSDLDFLKELDFGNDPNRHLYIVANKAQLKPKEDVEDILDKFEETLDDNDFSYIGISAYNSQKKEIHAYRKCDLFEFLEAHNKPSRKYPELKQKLYDVFKDYFIEANNDYDSKELKRKEVKKLILTALANGNINAYSDDDASVELESGLNDLLHYFQPKELKEARIKRISNLRDKFMDCLDRFCKDAGIEHIDVKYCEYCGEPHETAGNLCGKCSTEKMSKMQ